MPKKKSENFNIFLKLFIAFMFIIGFMIFCYPFIADSVNNYVAQQEIQTVNKSNKANQKRSAAKLQRMLQANRKRTQANARLGISPVKNILGRSLKNVPSENRAFYEKHSLGNIFIPKLSLSLPIFDRTSESLLYKGITLLPGSSYPVGGKSTHTVLLGHNGLPSQQLFTHLNRLKKGDQFFLQVYGKRLAYKVFRIKVVLPTDLDDVHIVPGQDLATLVTCTPYMLNTHRLLVTGRRVPLAAQKFDRQQKRAENYQTDRLLFFALLITAFLVAFCYFVWREMVEYLSHGRSYQLSFYIFQDGQAYAGAAFRLADRFGNPILDQQGQKMQALSDGRGFVSFGRVQGGAYQILPAGTVVDVKKIRAKVRHLKDTQFKIKVHGQSHKRLKIFERSQSVNDQEDK